MGGTCSPSQPDENEEEGQIDMDAEVKVDQAGNEETNEKFATIINDYQAENEQLRNELESVKNKNDESIAENEMKTKQNEEVVRELNEIKALLDLKNRAIERGRLETALLKSIVSMESTMKSCIQGELNHHHMKNKIKRYVEAHVCEGEIIENEYKAGYVMLTYSDDKNDEQSVKKQILELIVDDTDNKEKEHNITFHVADLSDEDAVEKITFSCKTVEQVGDWKKSIVSALNEVKEINDRMYERFTLKLEFSKEKMGIRVEERVVSYYDEPSEKAKLVEPGKVKKAIEEIEKGEKSENNTKKEAAMNTLAKVVDDMVKGIPEATAKENTEEKSTAEEKVTEASEKDEEKNEEGPCELVVTNISDQDLTAAGLKVNCVVTAINDRSLAGMSYNEQLDLLKKTPKPYMLTFTGENYLRHKPEPKHSYDSILKELTADGENSVKRAFHELVEGTPFANELKDSTDKTETIEKLLSNQSRLMGLLQKSDIQAIEL
jgi:hypothetical protein